MLANLRLLLIPLGYVYASAAWIRRRYFELLGKRRKGNTLTIAIGNLAVGGSGKTPMALWVARHTKDVAMLSRGYNRKTRGFREVLLGDTATLSGDEPLEMKNAFPELPVYVCENRLEGIAHIQRQNPEIRNVILDDAFQHLPLRADKYVLLTDYQKPFYQDWPMPAGRLREFECTANEADVIVITKCPADLDVKTAQSIEQKLSQYGKPVFYCHYENTTPINTSGEIWEAGKTAVVVSGLADNRTFLSWAQDRFEVIKQVSYPDHFNFTDNDYHNWSLTLENHKDAAIVTTRKDFMRMNNLPENLKKRIFMTFTTPRFLFQQEDAFIRILFNHL